MALTATMYRVDVTLSDVDRGVYEQLELRLARHRITDSPQYDETAKYEWKTVDVTAAS